MPHDGFIIYLDTRDLITITERWGSSELEDFSKALHGTGSALVFSAHNIAECSAPLVESKQSSVMKTLNALERLPHVFVAEANIDALELKEACKAFPERREYLPIGPFVDTFAQAISPFDLKTADQYRRAGLGEIIFDLWQNDPKSLKPYDAVAAKLEALRNADRKAADRDLRLYNIPFPTGQLKAFADWIWQHPTRCPALRLGYEVFHQISRNLGDKGQPSDIPDFAHIDCLPYVDVMTLDGRMREYVQQADRSAKTAFGEAVMSDVNEVRWLLG